MDLQTAVNGTFSHLQRLGRVIAGRGRPGLAAAEVSAKLAAVGLTPPPGLIELYGVCDGTETAQGEAVDQIQFFPGYYWMKLDEALEVYRSLIRDSRWNRAWLPVFANGGGDFYAVICDTESADFGALVGFILGESDHLVEFQDLPALIKTINRAFAEQAFFVEDGALEADYPMMRAIAQSLQPSFQVHDA